MTDPRPCRKTEGASMCPRQGALEQISSRRGSGNNGDNEQGPGDGDSRTKERARPSCRRVGVDRTLQRGGFVGSLAAGGERGDRPGRRVRSGSKKCTLAGAVRVGMHCENDVDVLNLGGWQAARRRTNPFGSRLENNAGAQARTRSQAVPAPPFPIIHDHVGQPSPTQQTWLQATRWGHIRRFTKRDRQDRRVHAAQFVW